MNRPILLALIAMAAAVLPGTAFGQAFPTKPMHLVTAEVGGGAAVIARLLAQGLSVNLGYQVVVENQGGANGIIAAQSVIKAPADGHTFLFYSSNIWLLPFLQSNAPFDPVRDLAPVMLVDRSPAILVVHPALPVRSVKQLIALAKARPGELNYGAGSAGAPPHLAAELFKSMAGVNIVRMANPDFQAKLSAIGVETVGGSPARFGEIIQADMAKWGKLIREGGVRSE